MSEKKRGFRAEPWIAVLGWVVALLSLLLNWVIYSDGQKRELRERREVPKYSFEIATYDARNLPDELLALKEPVRHNFSISHRTGRAAEDLDAIFKVEKSKILEVKVTEGTQGAMASVETSGNTAAISKEKLLPTESLRGYVVTEGIASVELSVSAAKGDEFSYSPVATGEKRFDPGFLLFVGLAVFFAGALGGLFYLALPAMNEKGLFALPPQHSTQKSKHYLAFAGFLILYWWDIFEVLPPLETLFWAIAVFFLATNYGNLVAALDRLGGSSDSQPTDTTPQSPT